jgi:hypothetical protein
MLPQSRVVRQDPWRFLSIPFVALVLLTALLVTILLVALVVATTVGPQLAHAVASFAHVQSVGSVGGPFMSCADALPTPC